MNKIIMVFEKILSTMLPIAVIAIKVAKLIIVE
jgi:hypothetical protein